MGGKHRFYFLINQPPPKGTPFISFLQQPFLTLFLINRCFAGGKGGSLLYNRGGRLLRCIYFSSGGGRRGHITSQKDPSLPTSQSSRSRFSLTPTPPLQAAFPFLLPLLLFCLTFSIPSFVGYLHSASTLLAFL